MKNTGVFKQFSEEEKTNAIKILNEQINRIDYSELKIDSLKGDDNKINFEKSNQAIYRQLGHLRNMAAYTNSLAITLRPAAYYNAKLDKYIAENPGNPEKIAAARAYQRYLNLPTLQHLDSLMKHESMKNGELGKIIEQIEKAKITIVSPSPQAQNAAEAKEILESNSSKRMGM
jgi:hypothetical protein